MKSTPPAYVQQWSLPENDPDVPIEPRLVEQDWRLVARVLRDLAPSV